MNDDLNWRYATKKFDSSRKIPQKELSEILEVLRLSPSSFGLQPWKFMIVSDMGLRKELQKQAWNQAQITEASEVIVFCALKTMDENYVKNFVAKIAQVRGIPRESLTGYEQIMIGFIKGHTPDSLSQWMKRQVYIALGMFLMECAHRRIDACSMEGFEPSQVNEVLGLEKQGIEAVVLCPVGYRSSDDKYAFVKKVRFEKSEVLIER